MEPLSIFKCPFSGIKYTYIIVQPSPTELFSSSKMETL